MTALSFGTVALGNLFRAMSEARAPSAIIDAAWDAGIRYYDTAPLYGHGLAELRIGHGLRHRKRDDYVLSSKVGRLLRPRPRAEIEFGGWVDVTPFELVYDYSYDGTMRAFEDLLQRLALERMEICFIHDIDVFTRGAEQPEVFRQAMDGCWRALERLRSEGSVKAIGVGVNEWEVCDDGAAQRDFDCFLLAGRYSLLEQEPLEKFLPLCVERNVAVVIGGGFNSGSSRPARSRARATITARRRRIMSASRTSRRSAASTTCRCQAAAMQFVIAHPAIASLIAGIRSTAQLSKIFGWFAQPIPAAFWSEMKRRRFLRDDAPVPADA